MIPGIGITSSNRRSMAIKDASGRVVARVSRSTKSGRKKPTKKINYNMRQVSARILKCKTSGAARMALTGARGKLAQLKRQLYDDGIDRYELEHAIIHAAKIARVAKKKLKHLQEEESAKQGGVCSGSQVDAEEDLDEISVEELLTGDNGGASGYGSDPIQEIKQELQRELQQNMAKAMQEEMQQLLEEALEESGLKELSEELLSDFSVDMDPEDLEEMKKKHRSEELKDILEADMKYLKAIFNKLQKEKEANNSMGASAYSNADSGGVSLELGGAEIPVGSQLPADSSVTAEGTHIDYMA